MRTRCSAPAGTWAGQVEAGGDHDHPLGIHLQTVTQVLAGEVGEGDDVAGHADRPRDDRRVEEPLEPGEVRRGMANGWRSWMVSTLGTGCQNGTMPAKWCITSMWCRRDCIPSQVLSTTRRRSLLALSSGATSVRKRPTSSG